MDERGIQTERLRLQRLDPTDLRALLEGQRSPAYLDYAGEYPMDATFVVAAMQERLAQGGVDVGPFGMFHVVRLADDVVIGDIGFHRPPDRFGDVSLGFGIVPAQRRRGYATEALGAMLAWACERPEVQRVHSDTDIVNLASQRMLERAGMRLAHDGADRKVYAINASSASLTR